MPPLRDILRHTGEMQLFRDVFVPCKNVLLRATYRGMRVDRARLEYLRGQATETIARLTVEVVEATNEAWTTRVVAEEAKVAAADAAIESVFAGSAGRCGAHPKYDGRRKATRRKGVVCEACADIHEAAADLREKRKLLVKEKAQRRTKVKAWRSEGFDPENPNHWRWLLYTPREEGGLGFKCPHWAKTDTGGDSANLKVVEKLHLQHEHPLLAKRVELAHAVDNLRKDLAVEPDADDRVRYTINLHKNKGRMASGTEDTDEEKVIDSAGNAQNIKKRNRSIYACRGDAWRMMQWDYSQIEGWLVGLIARDDRVLALWEKNWEFRRAGLPVPDEYDIHCLAAADIYQVPVSEVRTREVRFEGEWVSMRDAAKRRRHGRNYGLQWPKEMQMFGLTEQEAREGAKRDDEAWPRTAQWRIDVVREAERAREVRDLFGGRMQLFEWKWNKWTQRWETAEREEIIACKPQRTAAQMMKAVLPAVEAVLEANGGEFWMTVHDNVWAEVPVARIGEIKHGVQTVMQRKWPEFGMVAGFGEFCCPVDVEVGYNLGPRKCREKDNPRGLVKWEESEFAHL